MPISSVILAAGQGTRMKTERPKVLHRIAGKTLLEHVVCAARTMIGKQQPIVIHGYQGDKLQQALSAQDILWVHQTEQLGTGHAVLQALPHIPDDHRVLILYADVPCISENTLNRFIENTPENALGILTAHFPDPKGLGRIIRNPQNQIIKIVEEKDASESIRAINEINSGIYIVPARYLKKWLPKLSNKNAQGEYYLTDIIEMAIAEKILIVDTEVTHFSEVLGVNTLQQLATLERFYQTQQAEKWMLHGVTLIDPARFDVRGTISIGQDTVIDVNVILEGNTIIGKRCAIGANCILRDVTLADDVEIRAHSIIDGAVIETQSTVGPFARIRPGTHLAHHSHIGNFVEIKNSSIGIASKVNHLSYIGDSEIGEQVNVGAGTITCNYDGASKHKTIIDDYAFIGSNTSLVAPVTIHAGATIGAGSTITRDAPANQLTVARSKQQSIANWQRPVKNTEKEVDTSRR
ncbi:MAG: bifunctional UDP-N-acetylglucosamine diphosphorylase/glucosamine-1-phosphate N-acetyltransferase GlmU [Gammaproteobacteria bacterium]|nr:bifunctional UDP-N-acetylglucosamine diphosphorylase/glucosamine-1-phosphate N-acetyltransferase GlmU [Gammaproteobacteria bacterium]